MHIPKDNKSTRPLGIPAVEDKIVQMGMTKILTAIYEVDFQEESFGFRPGRGCHQALQALEKVLMTEPVNYIVDADIKAFFDSVDHEKLMECLKRRIADSSFLRLVGRMLKAGIVEEGRYEEVDEGTPQGGVLSPALSNIFLHYALDRWFKRSLKPRLQGYAWLIRYADDFVVCVQKQADAERVLEALEERMGRCGLSLSEEKTRLVEFGRYAPERAARRGEKPGTFNFLGFTHYCDRTRSGKFRVGRKTSSKKYRAKLKAMGTWLKAVRNRAPLRHWWQQLGAKLRGHYAYYGVSGNGVWIGQFYHATLPMAYKWVNRRSQKRSCNWAKFRAYLERYPLPKPRIVHSWWSTPTLSRMWE